MNEKTGIKDWLEEIGMGEHWEKFESNKIDEDILQSMTDNDLKDIGVDALGDRKKICAAISGIHDESVKLQWQVAAEVAVEKVLRRKINEAIAEFKRHLLSPKFLVGCLIGAAWVYYVHQFLQQY